MKRIALQNGSWFDEDSAKHWKEDSNWDGHNHISCNTGSQWTHERLYRSKGGSWILNSWSQWQGSTETYEVIKPCDAASWLIRNGYEDIPDELGQFVQAAEL